MLCEQVLGKLHDFDTTGKTIEYVDIEWHEAFKKIHKKTTDKGTEVGIRMDDSILARGLYQDDVIYADDEKLVVVNTPPCEVIRVSLTSGHEKMSAKVCYEIGNRHAPLFWGEKDVYKRQHIYTAWILKIKIQAVILIPACHWQIIIDSFSHQNLVQINNSVMEGCSTC